MYKYIFLWGVGEPLNGLIWWVETCESEAGKREIALSVSDHIIHICHPSFTATTHCITNALLTTTMPFPQSVYIKSPSHGNWKGGVYTRWGKDDGGHAP